MATDNPRQDLDEFYKLIQSIETAMLTTRRADGRLVSRPMATQEREPIADLWFVTDIESHKMEELEHDRNVNLGYFNTDSYEWVSVSGSAQISTDRELIRRLYKPDWKIWFGKVDEVRDGGPDDPRLALLLIDADTAMYMKRDKPKPMILFELVRGLVTGKEPEFGRTEKVQL